MKKLIALMICLCLMLALMAGCGESEIEYYEEGETAAAETAEATETDATEADPNPPEEEEPAVVGTGYATYTPDTVVGTVNGEDITWMEYYYWLGYYAQYIQQLAASYGLTLTGWDALEVSSSNTNGQVAIENAQYVAKQYHVMTQKAAELGITLSEEDEATVVSVFEQNADSVSGDGDGTCTEEEAAAFEAYLEEQCIDREFFDYLSEVTILNENTFVQTYGETGELLDEEAITSYVDENGLMAAKHILLLTTDTSTGESLDEETVAEKKALAEDLLAQLQAVADDQEAMVALFDDLMDEYNEDTGYATYPDGYIFTEGQMVESFENAVKELDVNYGLSGIVESEYGYHIILRIPVDPEGTVGTNSYGQNVTLRYAVANNLFSATMSEWMDAAEDQWNDDITNMDMTSVFGSIG